MPGLTYDSVPTGTPDFCHTQVLLDIFNCSNFKNSTFSGLKADSAEENKTRKKVNNAEENKTRKKNLSISNQLVLTISWSCFKSVKSKFIYFLTRTCRSTFKNYFVIAHLRKKFTIKAQQILDLPIRKRKLRKRWKNKHRAQRKLRKRWKNRHRAQRKLRKSGKKGIVRNANCAIAQLVQFAQLAKLANYFAHRPPLQKRLQNYHMNSKPNRQLNKKTKMFNGIL